MQNINILNKKYSADIEYVDDKHITLKANAKLGVESPSLDPNLKSMRQANTTIDANGNIITTCDLLFKSKSAIASFIVGSPQSGNRFFANYLGNSTTQGSAPQPNNQQSQNTTTTGATNTQSAPVMSNADRDKLAKDLCVFCMDFSFDLTPRALNEMYYQQNVDKYILNYMALIGADESMLKMAKDKMRSAEWKSLIQRLKTVVPTRERINSRLIIKYGRAGTGKTTDAIKNYGIFDTTDENNPVCVNKMAANPSMFPHELLTKFDPAKGDYVKTPIAEAMENGTPLIIDEVNFFSDEVMAMLQVITDNTNSIVDENSGKVLTIKDGFKLICTMNLHTNKGTRELPDPLVSRACALECYDDKLNLSWVW